MSVEERIKKALSEQLEIDIDHIRLDSHLSNDLGADSLDLVEATMELEDEFDCIINNEDLDSFRTVGDVVKWVTNHQNNLKKG